MFSLCWGTDVHRCAFSLVCVCMWKPDIDAGNRLWLLSHHIHFGRSSQSNTDLAAMVNLISHLALGNHCLCLWGRSAGSCYSRFMFCCCDKWVTERVCSSNRSQSIIEGNQGRSSGKNLESETKAEAMDKHDQCHGNGSLTVTPSSRNN